jgi:glycosyltransferase involved in cell wall biosynthesis
MNTPVISVVIPAYNCAGFLRESMDSLLGQTFSDFEVIIINDGSTDNTADIIRSYKDDRIIYTENGRNEGLAFTLNRGIDMARGRYIARMDGDDTCLPQRFQQQLNFFDAHPHTQILATWIELMDEEGKFTGYWTEEKTASSPQKIRSHLLKDNCIAHPTVMAKADLLKKYKYNATQSAAEDYDLWLRIAADNIPIHKLEEVLVKHRIVRNSFTRQRQKNVFFKLARTKWIFIRQQLSKGKLNGFIASLFFYMLLDMAKGLAKIMKRSITPGKAKQ